MARKKAEQSGGMEGSDAERIRARRDRLGMSKAELAREAGVSRTTLNALEAGEGFQRSTLTKVERKLAELEHEAGIDAPPRPPSPEEMQQVVEVELPDGHTVRVTTQGSVSAERVAEQIAALIQKLTDRDD